MLKLSIFLATCLSAAPLFAQSSQPQVRVNYLNVCAPSESDQRELTAALNQIPIRPAFDVDFEVARGRSTIQPSSGDKADTSPRPSDWVRLRRDMVASSGFSNAQYSFSVDANGMTETLTLHARDSAKSNILQVSIQDSVTSGTPQQVLSSDTPADRIRMERSGKASIVLARCPDTPQASYEPLFGKASGIMKAYRGALDVRRTVAADLARLQTAQKRSTQAKQSKHN